MNWLAFILTCITVEATPGPNMAYLSLLSLDRGLKAGLSAVAGTSLGLLIIGVLVSVGVGWVINEHGTVYSALRWMGVLYLLWLAFDVWREDPPSQSKIETEIVIYRRYFLRGLIINILNPKAAMFFIAVLPGFLPAEQGYAFPLSLTFIYVLIATTVHLVLVIGAARLKPFLMEGTRSKKVKAFFSLSLVLVAIWFALSTAL